VRADRHGRETWYGAWRAGERKVKRRIGPRRLRGTREGLTRVQAEQRLQQLMRLEVASAATDRRWTVGEAGELYVDHLETVMQRKRTTIQDYRGYLTRHLQPFFGDEPLHRIDPARVTAYLRAKLVDGLAPKTVNNHLNFLHGLFGFAVKRDWCAGNPVAKVDRPARIRSPHRRLRFLQPAELDRLIGAVPDDVLGAVERPLYLAAALTGARQGELIGLRWTDVDVVARRVRIAEPFTRGAFDSTKSHESRSVPLASRLGAALERHREASVYAADEDLVFAHPETGHVLDPSKLRRRFGEALGRAGLHRITFHELRHTFGTQMAAAGAPLRAIQEWMGHADAKTTEVYRHYAPDPTHGADLIDSAFGR
jgi:integrase